MNNNEIRVLFYFTTAFALSETFIVKQLRNTDHKLYFITERLTSPELIPDKIEYQLLKSTPTHFIDRLISFIHRNLTSNYKYSLPVSQIQIVKKFIVKNKIDVVHINYGTNAIKLASVLHKLKIPFIVHFHGYDASQLLLDNIYLQGLKKVFSTASKIIVVSNDMRNRLLKIGCPFENTIIVPYGVDKKNLHTSDRLVCKKVTLLHAGRLTPKKGVLDLVKTFDLVMRSKTYDVKVELKIIGDGEDMSKICDYIEASNSHEYIRILGSQPHNEVLEHMRSADIFVLNSRISDFGDMEGFPNTIIEAMASGCAVISTYHAGIPDAISNYVNGLLIEEKNNDQLKTAIDLLISNDSLRKKLASAAVETIKDKFLDSTMLKQYSKIYKEIKVA